MSSKTTDSTEAGNRGKRRHDGVSLMDYLHIVLSCVVIAFHAYDVWDRFAHEPPPHTTVMQQVVSVGPETTSRLLD